MRTRAFNPATYRKWTIEIKVLFEYLSRVKPVVFVGCNYLVYDVNELSKQIPVKIHLHTETNVYLTSFHQRLYEKWKNNWLNCIAL